MSLTVALVTGANRGIGFEVVRQLARKQILVFLGSRDLEKGKIAAQELIKEGLEVIPTQLDVTDLGSIDILAEKINKEYGRLDILVNNAGILYDTWQKAVNADLNIVREAFETNTLGVWQMCQAFIPLISHSNKGRIVNVSSGAGTLTSMGSGTPAYSISKVALNALTRMLAAELQGKGILVNSVCPGWVATDLGGSGGRPVADGAAGIVWAATLPNDGPTGGFFRAPRSGSLRDRHPLPW